jgi:hypothetical protein
MQLLPADEQSSVQALLRQLARRRRLKTFRHSYKHLTMADQDDSASSSPADVPSDVGRAERVILRPRHLRSRRQKAGWLYGPISDLEVSITDPFDGES